MASWVYTDVKTDKYTLNMYTLILYQISFNKGVKVVLVVSNVNKHKHIYVCYESENDSVFKDLKTA